MQRQFLFRSVVLSGMLLLQTFAIGQTLSQPAVPDLQISLTDRLNVFEKTWATVHKRFFDPKFNGVDWLQMKVKYQPLVEAATDKPQLRDVLTRMVNELHASHLGVNQGFSYNYGVDLTQIEGKWLVRGIAQNSIAQRDGIKRGWILTFAEGDCVGERRRVSVRLLDLQEQTRSFELICASHAFPPASESVRILEGGAVYLSFPKFLKGPVDWLADQVARNPSAPAIVLDLRGNSGGDADTFKKIFNLFFSGRTLFGTFRGRKGNEMTLKTSGSKSAYGGRLIVLTDRYTHSAAEVFAQAVQETRRGIVVGQVSFGGVLGSTNYKLPNGFDLHIPIFDYRTAKGVRLEGRGVQPDEVVPLTLKDFRENKDAVLDRVLELLQKVH